MISSDSMTASQDRTALRLFLFLTLALSLVLLWRQGGRGGADIMAGDGVGYFSHLPAALLEGGLDTSTHFVRFGLTGRNHWPVGTSLLWAPFYLIGHGLALGGAAIGLGWRTDGTGLPEQFACCFASIMMVSAAVALSYQLCRRWYSANESLAGSLGMLGAGSLLYYSLAEPYMSHAASAFLASLFVLLSFAEGRLDTAKAARLGALAGLMALTRPQDGVLLLLPFGLALTRGQTVRSLALPAMVAALISAMLFAPQIALWQWGLAQAEAPLRATAWVPGAAHQWASPALLDALWGARWGLFLWHPVALLAVVGLAWASYQGHRESRVALFGFLLQLYVVAGWADQGQAFGGRMFLVCFPLFCLGLSGLFHRAGLSLRGCTALLLALCLWNGCLILSYRARFADGASLSWYETLPFHVDFRGWGLSALGLGRGESPRNPRQ